MRFPLFSSLFLMHLCSLFLGFCLYAVSDQCLGDQQSLLLQLKNSLEFDPSRSTKLVHWNPNDDCCFWAGVTCNEGRVIGLDLSSELISGGKLDSSSSLFSLRYLQHLNLADNNFTGSDIPDQFLELKNLSYLNLSGVGFQGQIPIGISQLTRLVTLDLSSPLGLSSSNQLIIETPDLATLFQNLSALKELYLDDVNISAAAYEWCHALSSSLPNLSVLSMSRCELSGPLDSSLLNLQSLSVIGLDGNNFSGPMPEFFADFQNLTSLSLSASSCHACSLNGKFPQKILQVPTLQMLDLSSNFLLQGSLPEFPPNGSLRILVLSNTGFSGTLPHSIGNLKMLSTLDLSRTGFSGTLPHFIGNLKMLSTVDLSVTNFSGTLPHSIGNLKMLSTVDLSYCNFSGSIPSTMTSLTQLVYLNMGYNDFTGPIPSFSMAKNLIAIYLSGNRLTGQIISNRWEELVNLENLWLQGNLLEGRIPGSLFSLPSLENLDLSYNRFSGQVDEFSNISAYRLLHIDLSCNNLEGPIPMSLFDLPSLDSLHLSSNNFTGYLQLRRSLSANKLNSFPDRLRNQSNLFSLDLSNNHIQGEIPKWIWELPRLNCLNLSFNNLENMEDYLLNASSLIFLDLRSNQLQGPLPVLTSDCWYLDLSGNHFSSVIPDSIFNFLADALLFSVSSNKLYGSIPGSICNATQLQLLDLSDNYISGSIPQCLIGMSITLTVLNLRRNNLTGTISDTFSSVCCLLVLALSGNQLEGKLPKSLASCTDLKILDVENNRIEESFPCYLKDMSSLSIVMLGFNKFYGPIGCPGHNATWPTLQIINLASNNFSGKLPTNGFFNWTLMMGDDGGGGQSYQMNKYYIYIRKSYYFAQSLFYGHRGLIFLQYEDVVPVILKGIQTELRKILSILTSIDFSCNNFDGPIPEEVGELKLLYQLNLSHNTFMGPIPPSLGKLSQLESLDLSSNKLTGEIPVQLADGLIFLQVLNLSFNQLVGKIPVVKQFTTFLETSYEGNKGLCGFPLKEKCAHEESESPTPAFERTPSNSRNRINWNLISVELGFVFGFGVIIGPLVFRKRWRIWYYTKIDDICFRIFPRQYLEREYFRI